MIEQTKVSLPITLKEAPEILGQYMQLDTLQGEFLLFQRKEDSQFYFMCTQDCPIGQVCESFDWYIVSKDKFNDQLIIGAGLSNQDRAEAYAYRVKDETTLQLWKDILLFTFESDFVRQFFPYTNHFKGKERIDGALCFYIHDYYPVSHQKNISTLSKKVSNLVFRFKEGKQSALVAKLFSLAILRMPFLKELKNPILIPIPAATRERNIQRFAKFCFLLAKRLKIEDGYRATWIREDREQLKGQKNQEKLANLDFNIQYIKGKDILIVDDILTTGDSFIQMKRKLIQLGANSVVGLFFGKTVSRGIIN